MQRRRTSAALALCTAAFVFGAQLSETSHVEAEHVVCPEHGELIHGASGQGPTADADAVAGLDYHQSHNTHCAHAFAAQGIDSAQLLAWVGQFAHAPSTGAQRTEATSIPLLRLAPKASPPVPS